MCLQVGKYIQINYQLYDSLYFRVNGEQIFWWKVCFIETAIENYHRAGRASIKHLHFKTEIIWKQWKGPWVPQIGLKTHHIEHNIRSKYNE